MRGGRVSLAQERPGELVGSLLLGLYDDQARAGRSSTSVPTAFTLLLNGLEYRHLE